MAIHDVGEHEGQPWFAMDFVEGPTLADVLRGDLIPVARAIRWVRSLAEAVHYAHGQGVLHRDLKPSNILIDPLDQPHLTDFGLAKDLRSELELTLSSQALGSPNYMPPEQCGRGRQAATASTPSASSLELPEEDGPSDRRSLDRPVDERTNSAVGPPSDVYGLGAILYHLLTGRPPFLGDSVADVLLQVCEREPLPPRLLVPRLPRDLDTICLKCLEKDPSRRYRTAGEVAEELARWQASEPIHARPTSPPERAWRWCQKRPALAGALSAAAGFLIAGACGVLWQWREAQRNANAALQAATLANVEARRAAANEWSARRAQYASDMNLAHQAVHDGDFFRARQLLERHRPTLGVPPSSNPSSERMKEELQATASPIPYSPFPPSAPDLRGWEWGYLWRQSEGDPHVLLGAHTNAVLAVGRLPDAASIWSAGIDRLVKLWDIQSRKLLGELPHDEPVWGGVASPDGRWFVSVTLGLHGGHTKKNLRLWDLPARREVSVLFTNIWPRWGASVDISPDSKQLAFIDQKDPERLVVCELPSGREIRRFPAQTDLFGAQAVAYSPNGDSLAYSANLGGDLVILSTKDWAESARLIGHTRNVNAIAFSPDGRFLASVADDRTLRLWNLLERRAQGSAIPLSGSSVWVAFSPDSSEVAVATGTGVSVRRVPDLSVARELGWRSKGANAVAFVSDHEVVAGGENGSVAWFDLSSEKPSGRRADIPPGLALFGGAGLAVGISPDGSHLIGVSTNGTFQVWRTPDLRSPGPLPLPITNFACAAISARGEMIAFADQTGSAVLWNAADRSVIPLGRPQTNDYSRMAFSKDGKRLAFASDRKISVWDVTNRTETHALDKAATDHSTMWLGFSPDGTALASGNFSGNVRFWRLNSPGRDAVFAGHEFQVNGCDFTPDGKTLVTSQGHLCFWDLPSGTLRRKLDDLPGHAVKVGISPDGSRLAIGFEDGTIGVFDYPEMQELIRLTELDEVYRIAFSADGRTLIATSRTEIRTWNGALPSSSAMNPTREPTP